MQTPNSIPPSNWNGLLCASLIALASTSLALDAAETPAPVTLNVKRAITISFDSLAGVQYQLFQSSDAKTWVKYGGVIAGTGSAIDMIHVTENADKTFFRAETLSGQPVEVRKTLADFKDYKNWKLVRTLIGPDPNLGEAHGAGTLHRSVYVQPADARLVNGQYAAGTVFLKELREDMNGQPGNLTGALTVMVKRGGAFSPEGQGWEYFMADVGLNQTLAQGGSETMCFGCHSAAKTTDFVFTTLP